MVMHDFIVAFIDFIAVQYKSANNKIEYDDTKIYEEIFHFMHNEESCWNYMLGMHDLQKNNELLFLTYLPYMA